MVMKGESIPAHSIWEGAPAQPVRGHATACDGSQDVTGPSGDVAEPKGPSWLALRALPRT
jgi:hypothetical protein